jgi:carboxymethylenebutenolidase
MGQMVDFASNGSTAAGYLATPAAGAGPGVIVLQEWWGLAPEVKTVCDDLATEGFTALAPDLYHGELASHTEMDKAAQLMTSMPMDRAARDMGGAVDYLAGHEAVRGDGIGVIGFCMGGMLTLALACQRPDKIVAAVPYYGAPLAEGQADWGAMKAAALGHFAEKDDHFPADAVKELEAKLKDMGKEVDFIIYPGTGHAFASGHDALGTRDDEAARTAWVRTLEFLRAKLG